MGRWRLAWKKWLPRVSVPDQRGEGAERRSRFSPYPQTLEARVFYSATPLPVELTELPSVEHRWSDTLSTIENAIVEMQVEENIELPNSVDTEEGTSGSLVASSISGNKSVGDESTSGSKLIVIDRSIANYELLAVDFLRSNSAAILLVDSDESGIQAVSRWLASHQPIDELHLVAHGNQDGIQLGADQLNQNSLQHWSSTWSEWQSYLAPTCDLLIYGCEVASNSSGTNFLSTWANQLGVDVAASDDLTAVGGSAGDGQLEFAKGTVEAKSLFLNVSDWRWTGELSAPVSIDSGNAQETSGRDRGSHRAVAMHDNGSYVVVWSEQNRDGSGWGVFAQRFDDAGTAVGTDFQVNQVSANDQRWASVAMDGSGNFVVTWTSVGQDGDDEGIYARRYDAAGNALNNEFRVNSTTSNTQHNSSIAVRDDGSFVIVWEGNGSGDSYGIFARRYDSAGNAIAAEQLISTASSGSQYDASVAINHSGQIVVTWDDSAGFHAQRMNATGSLEGSRITISSSSSSGNGSVWLNDDGSFAVTWRSTFLTIKSTFLRIYDANGNAETGVIGVDESLLYNHEDSSITGTADGDFLIVWQGASSGDSSDIYLRKYSADGTALTQSEMVNSYTTGTQRQASVSAMSLGHYVVVWSGESATDNSSVSSELVVIPVGTDASFSMDEDQSHRFSLSDFGYSDPIGRPITGVLFDQINVGAIQVGGVAIVPGTLVSAGEISAGRVRFVTPDHWSGTINDAIHFRVVNGGTTAHDANQISFVVDPKVDGNSASLGDSVATETPGSLVNETLLGSQQNQQVVSLVGGGYVIVWQSTDGYLTDGNSGTKIHWQQYTARGAKVGGESLVNPLGGNNQLRPSIAALADGGFIVVWEETVTANTDIFAQRFNGNGQFTDLAGNLIGSASATRMNQQIAANQFDSDVIELTGGGFLVSWATRDATWTSDSSSEIVARVFDASGNGTGEFLVNQNKNGVQRSPHWTNLGGGKVAATWINQNGNGFDVQGRVFDVANPTSGTEFTVSQATAGRQAGQQVVHLGNGQWMVVWHSESGDGSGYGIYGRRFNAAGNPLDASDIRINQVTIADQLNPTVVALPDSSTIVLWHTLTTSGTGYDIVGRRLAADMSPLGDEFSVGAPRGYEQSLPRATWLPHGTLVVTWQTDRAQLGSVPGDLDVMAARLHLQVSGIEDTAIDIGMTISSPDQDGSEQISSVILQGIPNGFTVTDGSHSATVTANANIDVSTWNLSQLSLMAPAHWYGQFEYQLVIQATDGVDSKGTTQFVAVTIQNVDDAPVRNDWAGTVDSDQTITWTPEHWANDLHDRDEGVITNAIPDAWLEFQLAAGVTLPINGQSQMIWTGSGIQGTGQVIWNSGTATQPTAVTAPTGEIATAIHAQGAGAAILDLSEFDDSRFAIELWIRPDNVTQTSLLWDWGGAADGMALYQVGSTISWVIDQGNQELGQSSVAIELLGGTLSTTQFNQIVMVWDQSGNGVGLPGLSDAQLYVNGVLVDVAADLSVINELDSDVFDASGLPGFDEKLAGLGGAHGNAIYHDVKLPTGFQGDWATIRLYETTLDAQQVSSRYVDVTHDVRVISVDGQSLVPGGSVVLDSGAIVRLNLDGTFSFDPAGQFDHLHQGQSTTETFEYTISDAQGNQDSVSVDITIEGVDTPYRIQQIVPVPASTLEDTVVVFSEALGNPIIVGDDLPQNNQFQVHLIASSGSLQLARTAGLTVVGGANNSNEIIFTGNENNLNRALDGLQFTPGLNFNGPATITITTSRSVSLQGEYTFANGTAGDTSLGPDHSGEMLGSALVVTDSSRGQVLLLDGDGDAARVRSLFGRPANLTLSAWVNLNAADTLGAEVISLGDSVLLRLDNVSGGQGILGSFYDGSTWRVTSSGEFIAGTGWHHVAYVFDDSNNSQSLFLDGVKIAQSNFSQSVSYSRGLMTLIGQHGNGGTSFDFQGMIDDVRIYNRALTDNEMAGLADDDFSAQNQIALTVVPVNDAPSVSLNPVSLNENAVNVPITDSHLLATDVDHSAGQLRFEISQLPLHGILRLSGANLQIGDRFTQQDVNLGRVTYSHNGNEAAADELRLLLDDGVSPAQNVRLVFQINPVDDHPPVITSYGGTSSVNLSVAENQFSVGTVQATDADLPTPAISYSIVGGLDATRFQVNSHTGAVRFITPANAEAPSDSDLDGRFELIVAASDGTHSVQQTWNIAISDVDEFDVSGIVDLDSRANQVAENCADGSEVGLQANAVDLDATQSAVTYSLSQNADGRFAIDAVTGTVTVAQGHRLDREQADFYDLVVRASSVDGSFSERTYRIYLVDRNEFNIGPVSDSNSQSNQVLENSSQGTSVGITAAASDPDATNHQVTFRLIDDAGGRFAIDEQTGIVTVANNATLDFESQTIYTIRVEASSEDGSSAVADFNIQILDSREPAILQNDSFVVAEGSTHTSATGWLLLNDTFVDNVPYTVHLLTAPTQGSVIVQSDGSITYNHHGGEASTDQFWYEVRDAQGVVGSARVNVQVSGVDDAPIARDDSGITVLSGLSSRLEVSQLLANDSDADSVLGNLSIVTLPTHGQLQLGNNGQLIYISDQNYNGPDSFQYRVESQGVFSNIATVVIQVIAGVPIAPVNDGNTSNTNSGGNGNSGSDTKVNEVDPDPSVTNPATDPPKVSIPGGGAPITNQNNTGSTPTGNSDSQGLTIAAGDGSTGNTSKTTTISSLSTVGFVVGDMNNDPGRFHTQYGYHRQTASLVANENFELENLQISSELLHQELVGSAEFLKYMRNLRMDNADMFNLANFEVAQLAPTTAVSLFTVGYVAWLVRGGVLLTSFMSSLPSWQAFDPLPVLETTRLGKDENDASIEELVDGHTNVDGEAHAVDADAIPMDAIESQTHELVANVSP